MVGHSFGVVAAVYNYNRRSGLINDFLWTLFKVPAAFFYDDKFGFEPKQTIGTAMKAVRWLHSRLGADFAEKKVQLKDRPVILGIEYDLPNRLLQVTEDRREELKSELRHHLSQKSLTSGQAAKLKGKLLYAATQLWGKIGRAYLRPLSERQYSKKPRTKLDKALELALKAWIRLLDSAPRRTLRPNMNTDTDYVLFTDGFFPDWRKAETGKPQVGGVLFETKGRESPKYFTQKLEQSRMDTWITRKNQIAMVELFAPVLALETFKGQLKGKKVLLFVDSESVEGALVKGYSSREDISELVGQFWDVAASLECTIYIDRVSTDGNPAVGPSRPGKDVPSPELSWELVETMASQVVDSRGKRAWVYCHT